jgi:hypothetical protein
VNRKPKHRELKTALAGSGLSLITGDSTADAAQKVVRAVEKCYSFNKSKRKELV